MITHCLHGLHSSKLCDAVAENTQIKCKQVSVRIMSNTIQLLFVQLSNILIRVQRTEQPLPRQCVVSYTIA